MSLESRPSHCPRPCHSLSVCDELVFKENEIRRNERVAMLNVGMEWMMGSGCTGWPRLANLRPGGGGGAGVGPLSSLPLSLYKGSQMFSFLLCKKVISFLCIPLKTLIERLTVGQTSSPPAHESHLSTGD